MTIRDFLEVTYDNCMIIVEVGIEKNNTYWTETIYRGPAYGLATREELIDRKIVNVHPQAFTVNKILIK